VLCDALGEVERARAADVMLVKAFKLGVKGGIGLGLAIARSRSRTKGISVSATKRPPKMPKRPFSSGPLRKELGAWLFNCRSSKEGDFQVF